MVHHCTNLCEKSCCGKGKVVYKNPVAQSTARVETSGTCCLFVYLFARCDLGTVQEYCRYGSKQVSSLVRNTSGDAEKKKQTVAWLLLVFCSEEEYIVIVFSSRDFFFSGGSVV